MLSDWFFYKGCIYKCLTCHISEDNCTECKPNRDINNSCQCNPGYKEDIHTKECIEIGKLIDIFYLKYYSI